MNLAVDHRRLWWSQLGGRDLLEVIATEEAAQHVVNDAASTAHRDRRTKVAFGIRVTDTVEVSVLFPRRDALKLKIQ